MSRKYYEEHVIVINNKYDTVYIWAPYSIASERSILEFSEITLLQKLENVQQKMSKVRVYIRRIYWRQLNLRRPCHKRIYKRMAYNAMVMESLRSIDKKLKWIQ